MNQVQTNATAIEPADDSTLARILRRDRLLPKEVAHTVRSLAADAAKNDPRFHTWARQRIAYLTTGQEGRAQIPYAELSASRVFLALVRDVVRYAKDPKDVELIYHPSRVMDQIMKQGAFAGDCDDITAFACACFESIDLLVQAKLVSLHADYPDRHTHIFPQVWLSNAWVGIDPTLSDEEATQMADHIVEETVYLV